MSRPLICSEGLDSFGLGDVDDCSRCQFWGRMMAPFDGTSAQQPQHSGVAPPAMHPPAVPPGHQPAPSPSVIPSQHRHQQAMNAPYPNPGMHRQPSGGMGMGGPSFPIPQQSPAGVRQGSYGSISNGSGHHQSGSSQQFHAMHSPVHQPQHQGAHRGQMHPPQMHQQPHSQRPNGQQHPQHVGMQSRTSGSGAMVSSDSRQQYISTGLNVKWQSVKDMPVRRDMIQHM